MYFWTLRLASRNSMPANNVYQTVSRSVNMALRTSNKHVEDIM